MKVQKVTIEKLLEKHEKEITLIMHQTKHKLFVYYHWELECPILLMLWR